MELRRFGRHLERTLIADECIFILAEMLIYVAEVGPGIAMMEIELSCAEKAWKSFLMPAFHIKRSTEVVMKRTLGRLEARGVLITSDRVRNRFKPDEEITQIVPGHGGTGIEVKRSSVVLDRAQSLSARGIGIPEVYVETRVFGLQNNGALVVLNGRCIVRGGRVTELGHGTSLAPRR
jgi:hypothetical protein